MNRPANEGDPWLVYLDQNVLSRLRKGDPACESLREILNKMNAQGAAFVYSRVHVDECRASDRPGNFVDVIEAVSGWFIEDHTCDGQKITLSSGRAEELILADQDVLHDVSRRMEDILKPMHFGMGWLDGVDAASLRQEMVDGVNGFWDALEAEIPEEEKHLLSDGRRTVLSAINDMPLTRLRDEAESWAERFRARLPANYAQLDAVPAEQVVEHVFRLLDKTDRDELEQLYPHGFWADPLKRQDGNLTGFAFLLFILDIVRDSRVRKGKRRKREKHFRGQFRDCEHIEAASRCVAFITFDKGAARLAKAVYAYAGVGTQVISLGVHES